MKRGQLFNYKIEKDNYFIELPDGFEIENIVSIYPIKMAINNEIVDYNAFKLKNEVVFRNKSFVCCPINFTV